MALTYTLVPKCHAPLPDAAGSWLIEGGDVMQDKVLVATYSIVGREDCGTKEFNTAMLWMTLFFPKTRPPENITLHGSLDLTSGNEIGSVSAASPLFAVHIGKQFHRIANVLTIL
jgi:hypothetical protein